MVLPLAELQSAEELKQQDCPHAIVTWQPHPRQNQLGAQCASSCAHLTDKAAVAVLLPIWVRKGIVGVAR